MSRYKAWDAIASCQVYYEADPGEGLEDPAGEEMPETPPFQEEEEYEQHEQPPDVRGEDIAEIVEITTQNVLAQINGVERDTKRQCTAVKKEREAASSMQVLQTKYVRSLMRLCFWCLVVFAFATVCFCLSASQRRRPLFHARRAAFTYDIV